MKRFRNILCVLSDSAGADSVLQRSIALAQDNQASLTAVMIAPRSGVFGDFGSQWPAADQIEQAMLAEYSKKLELLVEAAREKMQIQSRILQGTPYLQVIREVLRNGYDLVIKLPDEEGFLDGLLGGDDMHLLRKCPCPVWLAKPQESKAYRTILAAVDVDDCYPSRELESREQLNRVIIELASSMAVTDFAELHIVHAWAAIGEEALRGAFLRTPEKQVTAYVNEVKNARVRALDTLLESMTGKEVRQALDYLKPQLHMIKGEARREIPVLAKNIDADLLVIGTVARTGIPGVTMGNTAETVLRRIQCSVLAIKPPGFRSSVELDEA